MADLSRLEEFVKKAWADGDWLIAMAMQKQLDNQKPKPKKIYHKRKR